MALKILLIRFSSIGDIVLTSPIIRTLKQQRKAELHFLTKQTFASIIAHDTYIDKVHLWSAQKPQNRKLWRQLRAEKFDLIVDLHQNLRSLKVSMLLGCKRIGFDKINWQKWRAVRSKETAVLPKLHLVDRYFQSFARLGITNDGLGLHFALSEDAPEIIKELPFEGAYRCMAIGGSFATKRLPVEHLRSIAQMTADLPLVLVGGPSDTSGAQLIASDLSHVYNYCGACNLQQSAALIQQATCVITHDTGMMHIAAAFQRPIISIWGNTVPEFGMYPYGLLHQQHKMFEVSDLDCRPCSKLGYEECPKGHFRCMQDHNLNEIASFTQHISST